MAVWVCIPFLTRCHFFAGYNKPKTSATKVHLKKGARPTTSAIANMAKANNYRADLAKVCCSVDISARVRFEIWIERGRSRCGGRGVCTSWMRKMPRGREAEQNRKVQHARSKRGMRRAEKSGREEQV